ncbi:MAG: zinc ribbon domain-containing protein [Blautia sp.]|nr:zinc ribbon domain-containing protein [Blautia sp.]
MAKDFFDGLGGTLSHKAQTLTEKFGFVYESQKLKSRISGEKRMIEKLQSDIGRIIYERFADGMEVDESLVSLCEEIRGHEDAIEEFKGYAAGRKGLKICPACKKEVDKKALFCPYCGTPVPNPEPEEEEESEFVEIPDEDVPEEETAEFFADAVAEAAAAFEAAGEQADAVIERAETVVEEALCETADAAEEVLNSASDAAEEALNSASDAAEEAFESVSDTAEKVVESISEAAEDAAEEAEKLTDAVSEAQDIPEKVEVVED